MAKTDRFNVAGKDLTAKELNVLKAVNAMGEYVSATQVEVEGLSVPAVRSTMARLSKTQGILVEKVALVDEKAVKTYAVAEGVEIPQEDE